MDDVMVIGIGNPDRSDDSIGILAARRIRSELPHLRVLESTGDVAELLGFFEKASRVLLIDALAGEEKEPGRLHELDVTSEPLSGSETLSSSHAWGVVQSIELARVLGRLPKQVLIFAIEGAEFGIGVTRSPKMTEALDLVVGRVAMLSSEYRKRLG